MRRSVKADFRHLTILSFTFVNYSEIARLTGTSPAWITAIMKLADLPVPEQEEILSS